MRLGPSPPARSRVRTAKGLYFDWFAGRQWPLTGTMHRAAFAQNASVSLYNCAMRPWRAFA
jgi:hypothetical protein